MNSTQRYNFILQFYGTQIRDRGSVSVVRLPVNSLHSQLVTGRLVPQSTRHKEAVNSS